MNNSEIIQQLGVKNEITIFVKNCRFSSDKKTGQIFKFSLIYYINRPYLGEKINEKNIIPFISSAAIEDVQLKINDKLRELHFLLELKQEIAKKNFYVYKVEGSDIFD